MRESPHLASPGCAPALADATALAGCSPELAEGFLDVLTAAAFRAGSGDLAGAVRLLEDGHLTARAQEAGGEPGAAAVAAGYAVALRFYQERLES